MSLLVQKFGGTSLADLNGFDASAAVIAQYTDQNQVIVVLSAVKGVTDLLLAAIDTAVTGADPHAMVEALANAEMVLDTAVTIRDKVVEAYQELLRMPV